jgi:hypothetical protein
MLKNCRRSEVLSEKAGKSSDLSIKKPGFTYFTWKKDDCSVWAVNSTCQ